MAVATDGNPEQGRFCGHWCSRVVEGRKPRATGAWEAGLKEVSMPGHEFAIASRPAEEPEPAGLRHLLVAAHSRYTQPVESFQPPGEIARCVADVRQPVPDLAHAIFGWSVGVAALE